MADIDNRAASADATSKNSSPCPVPSSKGQPIKRISTFEEYDAFLADHFITRKSYPDLAPYLAAHQLNLKAFATLFGEPAIDDPFSDAYAARELRFFQFLAGRPHALNNEGDVIDIDHMLSQPPYSDWDAPSLINQYRRIGDTLNILQPGKKGTFLEMGCGEGYLLEIFGRFGWRVFGIEASKAHCELAKKYCATQNINAHVYNGSFYDVAHIDEKFDIILFEASFHHCGEPVRLLKILREKLTPTGKLIFLREPVADVFSKPWGIVRNDGVTAFRIRKQGWLELGFRQDFFYDILSHTGWLPPKKFVFDYTEPIFCTSGA